MTLTKHEMARIAETSNDGTVPSFQYSISGLPPGEQALIAEFPIRGWRILRWNEQSHGNWTGSYSTADKALEALQEQINMALA